ncbi:unnamed protein product [Owenia fusiformis]|uniref:RAG1 importin-binding domain-containing protein n=1 Tax=Owenia fusiformis TaxID=6347 RepID=A0A8J1UJS1_OWEFU|nr:unnamed protein product [Owenia fusiformis]
MADLDFHRKCISNMCRICGSRAQTFYQVKTKVTPYLAQNNKDMILKFYGIDISNDSKDIYPVKICQVCYSRMWNFYRDSQKSFSDFEIFHYVKHTSDPLCKTCAKYSEGSKTGRKKKNKRGKIMDRVSQPALSEEAPCDLVLSE